MSRTLAAVAAGVVENLFIGRQEDFPTAIDVTDLVPQPSVGWLHDGAGFMPNHVGTGIAAQRIITRRALRSRFTIPELVGIEIASLDDPAAPIEARQTAATLRVLLATLNSADFIDLDFAEARMGVQMIGQFGLLSAERVIEILDTPVDDSERP